MTDGLGNDDDVDEAVVVPNQGETNRFIIRVKVDVVCHDRRRRSKLLSLLTSNSRADFRGASNRSGIRVGAYSSPYNFIIQYRK